MQVGSEFYPNNFFCYCEIREGVKLCMLLTVAPWAYKDKKLVSLKISDDPSYFWSTDSKTVFR